jgi:tetratricopeptide (TPR) repeat protein
MRHFEILLQECDADIRAGRSHQVGRRLAQAGAARIPRAWRLPLAKTCRRAGLYTLGLRLLNRLVNGPTPKASPAELTEYSALLIRSGAVDEALANLSGVDFKEVPEAMLVRAFGLFARWEYQEAIPDLQNYLQAPLPDAALLVGRSNLALALVETRQHVQARTELEENIRLAKDQGAVHLENYNISLLAQVHLQEGNFAAARRLITSAVPDASKSQSNNDWSALKLKLVLDGLENRDTKPLLQLRKLAEQKKDWSAIRDADLYLLKVDFKVEGFLHLYFGSPLPGFRNRIRDELGRVPDRRIYVLGKKSAPRFDLEAGQVDGKTVMRAGLKCHQLISVLLRDFYQPLRIGGLHAALFPGDHFDISSSPDRVHQVLRRTRRWLDANRIPVRIEESDGFYSLAIEGNISFRIPIDQQPKNLLARRMEKLMGAFPEGELFTTEKIQDRLGISMTSAHRLLHHAIEAGKVERLGNLKRPTGYRVRSAVSKLKSAA